MPQQPNDYVRFFNKFLVSFRSLTTGKLATNELPLPEDAGESSDTTCYSNPLTIAEDSELDTTATCSPTKNQRSQADKKYVFNS